MYCCVAASAEDGQRDPHLSVRECPRGAPEANRKAGAKRRANGVRSRHDPSWPPSGTFVLESKVQFFEQARAFDLVAFDLVGAVGSVRRSSAPSGVQLLTVLKSLTDALSDDVGHMTKWILFVESAPKMLLVIRIAPYGNVCGSSSFEGGGLKEKFGKGAPEEKREGGVRRGGSQMPIEGSKGQQRIGKSKWSRASSRQVPSGIWDLVAFSEPFS